MVFNAVSIVFKELKASIKNYHEKINWLILLLLTMFCISSWIDLNGLWVELPIMVHELPEGWRLPSVLVLMTQLAQIGPIVFLVFKWCHPKRISYVVIIYVILAIAALSCLLLVFFWKKTIKIGTEERSIGLYILTFCLSVLDGMSTVVYLAYIGTTFQKEYIISNFLGESLASMVPGLAGLIQGVSQDLRCRNVSVAKEDKKNETFELQAIPLIPTFSVSIYFLFLFLSLCVSILTFSLANYLPSAKKTKKIISDNSVYPLTSTSKQIDDTQEGVDQLTSVQALQKPSKREQALLLCISAGCYFLIYGVLPALQSYSTLPYGNNIFHLSITLCLFFLPITTFLSTWSNNTSSLRISIEFLIAVVFAVYIIVISTLSPCPPLLDSKMGPVLMLVAWMICPILFMRIRYCISTKLEVCGETQLVLIGAFSIAGQIAGGVLMYILIDVYRLFNDVPECVTIKDYCLAIGH